MLKKFFKGQWSVSQPAIELYSESTRLTFRLMLRLRHMANLPRPR